MRFVEYEFTRPDGTKAFEIVTCPADLIAFKAMHKATAARPINTMKGY